MEIRATVREIVDWGLWLEMCEVTRMNEWAINEGMIDYDETITLTVDQAMEIGLLRKEV